MLFITNIKRAKNVKKQNSGNGMVMKIQGIISLFTGLTGKWINPFKMSSYFKHIIHDLNIAHGLNHGLFKCVELHKTVLTVYEIIEENG